MSADLTTTNLWLGVLTAAVVLQTLLFLMAAIWLYRLSSRVGGALERAERALEPLGARVAICLDDLRAISTAAQRAEATIRETTDSVRAVTHRVGSAAQVARAVVTSRLWPVTGLLRGLAVAAGVLASARRRRLAREREDADDEERFLYEGGANDLRATRPRPLV